MATANLVYAKQQFSCTSQLLASGFASHQDLDKGDGRRRDGKRDPLARKGAMRGRPSRADK
jgi:hypothetical protein